MTAWEDFEIKCTEYLNQVHGELANFTHQGGADSTTPDIIVKTKTGKSFYIEAKHSPAQCGQFVLLPNIETRSFEYSPANVNQINIYAEKIMQYMNQSFDEYREAGTTGKDIDIPNSSMIFSNWIIQIYKSKGVLFFITNNFTIVPIADFPKYFDVTATYRIKRSGSGEVAKSRLKSVIDYIFNNNYDATNYHIKGKKLFIHSQKELHNQRFVLDGFEYMFSKRENMYEIRKLSNTYNANVIFSVEYNGTSSNAGNAQLYSQLQ